MVIEDKNLYKIIRFNTFDSSSVLANDIFFKNLKVYNFIKPTSLSIQFSYLSSVKNVNLHDMFFNC